MDDFERLKKEIAGGIYENGMLLTWYRNNPSGWKLASGAWSPFYINLRQITSFPRLYSKVIDAFCMMLDKNGISISEHKAVGIAMGGIALANGVSLRFGMPSLYTRKLPEGVSTKEEIGSYISSHGQHALVEGVLKNNDRLMLFDDVVTSMESKVMAINQISMEVEKRRLSGIAVEAVYVVVDRGFGKEKAKALGLELHSILTLEEIVNLLGDALAPKERDVMLDYLKDAKAFQDAGMQNELRRAAKE
ncbi:MAG: hypothetical protein LVQ97_03020 [Candidatus Micrarchaeales archaeon]|jgi:orotate phosphoribosyltransferase|uniref:Orotate phosphoribosyltransferase n=1 Tax=Candidatus Micrarchaeum acidiphilum ARMAN-2 TaxID=425595 RepID=C7DGC8_MICA2|nr:MAG: phosphoribosyltransferase [Candidatus Micrarchaeum acidiphilum ARMAN-2]MCW6161131.1 hypothetical protein [Candidatus Micrarchaeales archaeon]